MKEYSLILMFCTRENREERGCMRGCVYASEERGDAVEERRTSRFGIKLGALDSSFTTESDGSGFGRND